MKKLLCILAAVALLFAVAPTVLAAGSAYWGGPSVIRAGDTVTLTFYAGGGIYGGSGSVSYDSSQLTLQSYTQAVGGSWVVEFIGNNFVFYDNSMKSPISGNTAIFKATFKVNSELQTGETITVSAVNVKLSDRQQDMNIGTTSYSKSVAAPLSANNNLSSLTVSGAAISPAFSPSVTKYSASVPFTTASIGVTAYAEDAGAKVSVSNPQLIAGTTTTVQITVTAENGAVKQYYIYVTRAQDPNYVPSSNTNLSSLSVSGYPISPAFSPEVKQYYVWLPYEAASVAVSASQEDEKAAVKVDACPELTPGAGTDIAVTVTAEDGSTAVYTVTAVRAPELERTEQYLNGEREPEPTEPPTEPPTEAPTTEPEEAPTQPEVPNFIPPAYNLAAVIAAGIAGALIGAVLALLIVLLTRKKK